MANWYGTARSNYFQVNDEQAFLERCKIFGLEVHSQGGDAEIPKAFMVHPTTDDGSWPQSAYALETEENEYGDFNIGEEIQKFLLPGSVAILGCVGAEKIRYLTADVIIVTTDGVEYRNFFEEVYAELLDDGLNATRMEY